MNQDISILFEDLKYVKTSPPMGGCMVCGLVDGWVFLLTFWYLTAYLKHLSPLQGYFSLILGPMMLQIFLMLPK